MRRLGAILNGNGPKKPLDEVVLEMARRGEIRTEAADKFVRHLRMARARKALDGSPAAEAEREAKAIAQREAEREAAAHKALGDARILVVMHSANFDTTETGDPLVVDPSNAKAHKWAKALAERWTPRHKGLIFSGPVGCGKTYLATAVLVAVIRRCGRPVYGQIVTERDLLQVFRQSYNRRPEDMYTPSTLEVRERYIVRPELLVLDDFGAEQPSTAEKGDWARGQIMDLVEYRSREKKTTIVTTNLSEDEISKRYDNRILSRLTGHSPWQTMAGPDFRQTVAPDSDDPFEADRLALEFNQ